MLRLSRLRKSLRNLSTISADGNDARDARNASRAIRLARFLSTARFAALRPATKPKRARPNAVGSAKAKYPLPLTRTFAASTALNSLASVNFDTWGAFLKTRNLLNRNDFLTESSRQYGAALCASGSYHGATAPCFHACAKSVRARPLHLGRLISSFHDGLKRWE